MHGKTPLTTEPTEAQSKRLTVAEAEAVFYAGGKFPYTVPVKRAKGQRRSRKEILKEYRDKDGVIRYHGVNKGKEAIYRQCTKKYGGSWFSDWQWRR